MYSVHVHCSPSQRPWKKREKKKEMIRNLLPRPLERWAPYQNERPPRVSHSCKERKEGGKSEARTRCTRDARNAPCSNRFSTVARSSLTNQTLTSADASRQSNLSRKTLRRGQDDEWSELPPSSSSRNCETLYSITRIFHRSSTRV